MINTQENTFKLKMLNEFETQIRNMFLKFNNNDVDYEQILDYMDRYFFFLNYSRFDLKNMGDNSNTLRIIKHNTDLDFWFPSWFTDDYGHGCQLQYKNQKINLNILCEGDGEFRFYFRGIDFKTLNNQRIPLYVNYENIWIDKLKLEYPSRLVWHDEPIQYSKSCQDGEIINLKIESKTIVDYFPQLKNFFKDIPNSSKLNREFLDIIQFIEYEKVLIKQGINQKLFYQFDENESNFYLNMNTKLLVNHLNNEIYHLRKEFTEYKENTDKIINSYYDFFNTLFLYYNLDDKGLLKYTNILNQELLNFVVNICNKYGLKYWLDFGLLLGAVRHEGFIPWDDDVDIGMMREDYDIFLEKIKEEIDNNGLSDFLRISLNRHYFKPLPILQLLYYCEEVDNTIIAGIDIFPYDFIDDISDCNVNTYTKILKSVTENNLNGIPIEDALKEYFNKFNISYGVKDYIIPGVEGARGNFIGYDFVIFDTKDIFPLKKTKFEGMDYLIPNNSAKYLSQTYGDYLNIPKIAHNHQSRYDSLRKREDSLDIFKKNIIKMKKINEKYCNNM